MFFYLMFLKDVLNKWVKKCQTFTTEKNWRSQNLLEKYFSEIQFLGKEIWRNALALKSKKVKVILGKAFLVLTSSAVFRLLNCVSDFYESSLGNEIDCRTIMDVSPDILDKNQNFKKLRHIFADERTLITTTLISSCHGKTLVPFCLQKKRPENAFLTLIVNYRKIVQKNKLCHPKQQ